MKDKETIRRFVELRAQGLSFAAIAAQLDVSKTMLIQWSRLHQFEIQNLRSVETEALVERCFSSRQHRWEQVALHLRRVEEELAKRDLTDVPTSRLLFHAARLRHEIGREAGQVSFSISTEDIPAEAGWRRNTENPALLPHPSRHDALSLRSAPNLPCPMRLQTRLILDCSLPTLCFNPFYANKPGIQSCSALSSNSNRPALGRRGPALLPINTTL